MSVSPKECEEWRRPARSLEQGSPALQTRYPGDVSKHVTGRMQAVGLIVASALVVAVTLSPEREGARPIAEVAGRVSGVLGDSGFSGNWGGLGLQFPANVALFIPIGAVLAGLTRGPARWLVFVLFPALPVAIETAQHLFLPGRSPETQDIVANSLGGWLGMGSTMLAQYLVARSSVRAGPLERTAGDGQSLRAAAVSRRVPFAVDAASWVFSILFVWG